MSPLFKCPKCGRRKAKTSFAIDRTQRFGRRRWCKKCSCTAQAAYYQRTRPTRDAYARAWYAKNKHAVCKRGNEKRLRRRTYDPIGFLLQRLKVSAKSRGVAFNLRREDIHIPRVCPALGIRLVWPRKLHTGRPANMPSADRVDPKRGYVKGNVRIISSRANSLKNNASLAELRGLVRYVEGHRP
jgi:hypothetical protein